MQVGDDHSAAKLDDIAVRYIRASDLSLRALGEQLKVHWTTVRSVRNGETWKHVRD